MKNAHSNFRIFVFTRGNKFFELSNHLGNVLATINDKKVQVDDGTYAHNSSTGLLEKVNNTLDGVLDYYKADLVTAMIIILLGCRCRGGNINKVTTSIATL